MTALHRSTMRIELTIKAGESESNVGSLGGFAGGILFMPDDWTAANIAFLTSATGESGYKPLEKDATLLEIAADPLAHAVIPPDVFPLPEFKLFSESAGVAVNQIADRVIVIVAKS